MQHSFNSISVCWHWIFKVYISHYFICTWYQQEAICWSNPALIKRLTVYCSLHYKLCWVVVHANTAPLCCHFISKVLQCQGLLLLQKPPQDIQCICHRASAVVYQNCLYIIRQQSFFFLASCDSGSVLKLAEVLHKLQWYSCHLKLSN